MINNTTIPLVPTSYLDATGKIDYGMTNDYMFRAILQENSHVLKGIICSMLHLKPEDVISIEITNPIELGASLDDKEFILDIQVLLNDNTIINLEMQMENELNWQDRSLSYLCRSYDQLYRGQDYASAKPAIHIGFLNFTPFPEHLEFNATYKLLNLKDSHPYSDKFTLCVVDLKHIELATEEDRAHQIDYWARLFTATSWEEIKMIAKDNKYMDEACQKLYELNADEITRQKCLAREDYYRLKNAIQKKLEYLTEENATLTQENEYLRKMLAEHGIESHL